MRSHYVIPMSNYFTFWFLDYCIVYQAYVSIIKICYVMLCYVHIDLFCWDSIECRCTGVFVLYIDANVIPFVNLGMDYIVNMR